MQIAVACNIIDIYYYYGRREIKHLEKFMLQLIHLKKMYGKNLILTDVNWIIEEEGIYPVLGAKGSGKTTFFKCINGDTRPDSGSVKTKAKKNIFMASKESKLPEYITGYEFIDFICKLKNDAEKPETYLEKVKFPENMEHIIIRDYEPELKKRLQLAAFLVQQPYVMLFDEALDDCSEDFAETFLDVLETEKDRHIILISTKYPDTARMISDDIFVLNNGEINCISAEMLDVPEIKQAIDDILGEDNEITD